MYTQCPDCSTAFRVTADVLKQAAGKVRCGGCRSAFNALEYLSEGRPEEPAPREPETPLPELTPEPASTEDGSPMTISAEQSAALLKTLDELAGSDIRIEDTGVEWRVLDENAIADSVDDEVETFASDEKLFIDELLDESPTPVDQFLTQTPSDIEAGEIFEESANAAAQTPVEEMRFDDYTPLPDDFDLDDESSYVPESTSAEQLATDNARDNVADFEFLEEPSEWRNEETLGDPDEWADILGEVVVTDEPHGAPIADTEALEKDRSTVFDADEAQATADDDVATPPDVDTQFALQAEAMGIDLSGIHASPVEEFGEQHEDVVAEERHETELGADDDTGVVPELEVAGEIGETPEIEASDETGERPEFRSDADMGKAFEPDVDAELTPEFDLGEETGEAHKPELEDAAGEAPKIDLAEDAGDTNGAQNLEESGERPALELADATNAEPPSEPEQLLGAEIEAPPAEVIEISGGDADGLDADDLRDDAALVFGPVEKAIADLEEQSDVFDREFFADAGGADNEQAERGGENEFADSEEISHYVPPQSEEEQTLNRMIDQELLSFAVEDEDGFASTIVASEQDIARDVLAEKIAAAAGADQSPGFESIVMEGEFVRSALESEKRSDDIAAAAALLRQSKANEASAAEATQTGNKRGMLAAAVILALLLVVQVVHQSREALATIPAFNETMGPLYRAIGKPLIPTWDVTGWRFEARRDIVDAETGTLTVISRIGNTSAKPLPYPVINVSLIDRFDETVGNETLDPVDYLTDDPDPSALVHPGSNFTAVMSIESPSEDATGYKLQACYRLSGARLRCHLPDFK